MVGHLFQGRYKSILCDRDAYLLQLVRYIQFKSGADEASPESVEVSQEQPSGFLGEPGPVTIQTTSVLKQFGSNASAARREYPGFTARKRIG